MKHHATNLIAEAIRDDRPMVLLAGQDLDSASDAVLRHLLDHLRCENRTPRWRAALSCGMTLDDMSWLSERFDRTVPSDSASAIFDLPWCAVFTSTIDPQFARRFETRGRQPEPVLAKQHSPTVPRSRYRPPIYYLLGKADERERDTIAPTTTAELQIRLAQHASDLMNRIAETATPHGIIMVAGYTPSTDWLPLDTMLASLYSQGQGKVLWFDDVDNLTSDIANLMIKERSLIPVPERLSSIIENLIDCGEIDFSLHAQADEPGIVSLGDGIKLNISPELRLRVESSASIVDDEWLETTSQFDHSGSYSDFRRFHASLDNFRLLVSGILQGFAIERDFETILWNTVEDKIRRLGQQHVDDVVILHGQSGTGKTIALARLTLKIRQILRLPVVVATNRMPNHTDIDSFCLEPEQLGAPATVLICDTGHDPRRYYDIASALRSRGRRLLLVATSYRIDAGRNEPPRDWIEAAARVSSTEISALKGLLLKFDVPSSQHHDQDSDYRQAAIALFYRQLPSSRESLASGLSREARVHEDTIRKRAKNVTRPRRDLPPLARELIRIGLAPTDVSLFSDDSDLTAHGRDAAARLVNQVMAAGRLNCPVPINLLIRSLADTEGLTVEDTYRIFHDIDLFRWRKDNEGTDFLVSPRIQLEADLICRRRLAPEDEIDCLINLISHVKFGLDANIERVFLLDVVSKIRRTGPRGRAYQSGYLLFANALRQVRRINSAVFDPTLVLQECVLRRQAVYDVVDTSLGVESDDDRLTVLNEARIAIDTTLRRIESESMKLHRKTRQRLLGERSAIYGYLAVHHARSDSSLKADDRYWSYYLAARAASSSAIGLGEDFHTIDIALWTARDVLSSKTLYLSDEQQAEIIADLYSTVDIADDMFGEEGTLEGGAMRPKEPVSGMHRYGDSDDGSDWLDQRARYLEKRASVANIVGNSDLRRDTLNKIEKEAPQAATFLIARDLATRLYESSAPYGDDAMQAAKRAANYICQRDKEGKAEDDRCQRLLLKLRWAQATGDRLLFRQRGSTPTNSDHLSELRMIVSGINERAGYASRNRERFLEAVLCWLLNDFNRAADLWRSLSRDSEYEDRSRVVRWLVATADGGGARRFRGRVIKDNRGDWKVRVEGVDRPISLLPRDFRDADITLGRRLRGFGVAFNYIGPIADPLLRGGGR